MKTSKSMEAKVIKGGGITSAKGFKAAGVACGIKPRGEKDMALIVSDVPAEAAATFTTNLVKAFEQAKQMAYHRVRNPRMVPLAWVRTAVEEQEATLGKDPWEYGLTAANRKNLETIQRYVHQQGMTSKIRRLEELFDDTDLGDAAGSEEY